MVIPVGRVVVTQAVIAMLSYLPQLNQLNNSTEGAAFIRPGQDSSEGVGNSIGVKGVDETKASTGKLF